MNVKLSIYRRYNLFLIWREYRRAVWLSVAAVVVGFFVLVGIGYATTHNALLDAKLYSGVQDLCGYKVSTLGAPGYTRTDWVEGTTNLEVRKIK